MRYTKKLVCLVVFIAIMLSSFPTVYASEWSGPVSPDDRMKIITALWDMETEMQMRGTKSLDFNLLNIGEPIYTYNYESSGLVPGSVFYPLSANNRLVYLAVKLEDNFQISPGLVLQINEHINHNTPFALIYDATNAYAYVNNQLIELLTFASPLDNRATISKETVFSTKITTTSLANCTNLAYNTVKRPSAETRSANYLLDVAYTTQHIPINGGVGGPYYTNLCWAASMACIHNYLEETDWDALYVAQRVKESTNPAVFDVGIGLYEVRGYMLKIGLNYTWGDDYLNKIAFDCVLRSLYAGLPVYASFEHATNPQFRHAVVIYGYHEANQYLRIMNPSYGMHTANLRSDGRYSYHSTVNNSEYILNATFWHEAFEQYANVPTNS